MNKYQINYILDALFFDFEKNKFVNDGIWSYEANLIFAFSDYIENITEEDLIALLPKDIQPDLAKIKQAAILGINRWLNENMKTFMM